MTDRDVVGEVVVADEDRIAVMLKADLEILDALVEKEIKPIADLGNPEKLIGKKFEEWTPEDMALLTQIYPNNNDPSNPLNKVVFEHTHQAMLDAEEAENAA